MWPNLRRAVNTKISQQPPTFLNIPKEIESAIHGKELNLEVPLHSSFIFLCVFALMESFRSRGEKGEEVLFVTVNIAKPQGVTCSVFWDPESSKGYASGDPL